MLTEVCEIPLRVVQCWEHKHLHREQPSSTMTVIISTLIKTHRIIFCCEQNEELISSYSNVIESPVNTQCYHNTYICRNNN